MFTRIKTEKCEAGEETNDTEREESVATEIGDASAREDNRKMVDEMKKLRTELEDVKGENQDLKGEVSSLKERMTKLENYIVESASSWNENGDLVRTLYAFKKLHGELKRNRTSHNKTIDSIHTWRGIVDSEPEISWTIDHYSYFLNYERMFEVPKYFLACLVSLEPASSYVVPRVCLELFFDVEADDPILTPAAMVVVKGRDGSGVEKRFVERQVNIFKATTHRYKYGRSSNVDPAEHRCVSLNVSVYLELPWATREIQSEDGVLFWTVENFGKVFSEEEFVLYSPYFCAVPRGYRMQAVLYTSTKNLLTLFVIKRNEYVQYELQECVISVTVFKPNSDPNRITQIKSTDFNWGEEFALGKVEDVIEHDTFLVRVKITFD